MHAQINQAHKAYKLLYEKALQTYQLQKALYDLQIFPFQLLIIPSLLGLAAGRAHYVLREIQRHLQARQALQKETTIDKLKKLDRVIPFCK